MTITHATQPVLPLCLRKTTGTQGASPVLDPQRVLDGGLRKASASSGGVGLYLAMVLIAMNPST
jgi:hypothetical protein